MAIWSWKVLPVRGSCGDRRLCQGHRASPASTMFQAGPGGRVLRDSWVIFSPSCTSIPALWRLILKPRDSSHDSNLRADSTQTGVSRTPQKKIAPKVDGLTVFRFASGDLERRSIDLLRLAPVTGVTSMKPMRSAFSSSPIKTRRAASAASCLPCFLLCAQTAGNQRPPTLAW